MPRRYPVTSMLIAKFKAVTLPNPTATGCIEWPRARNQEGYGVVAASRESRSYAHRIAWKIAHPDEAVPVVVRHGCDNPPCVNAEHLLSGTQVENLTGAIVRRRHPGVKLTEDDVRAIRASTEPSLTLAHRYGVSDTTIRRTRAALKWKHVA